MEIRDFFTETEIRAMKERIVRETCLANFLVKADVTYEDGETATINRLTPDIERVIREETVKQVKEYVREIVTTVAKERVAAAVDKFSANLCSQLEKIADKTNWYWSVK